MTVVKIELKISLNSLYTPTRTEFFCSFLSDNSYGQQFSCTVSYCQDGDQSVVDPVEGSGGGGAYLRIWMTAPLHYLKVWIRHCTYIKTVSKITSIVFDNSYLCVDDICLSVIIRSYKQQVEGCFECSSEFKCGKPKYSSCTFIVFSVDVILKRFSFKYFYHK